MKHVLTALVMVVAACGGNVEEGAPPDIDAGSDGARDAPKSYAPYTCHDGAVVRPNGADCTCADGSGSVCADGACVC